MDFHEMLMIQDPHETWDAFYKDASARIDSIYPQRKVRLTTSEPSFMTPEIKSILRRKNRLMHRGRIEEASALTRRVSIANEKGNKRHLRDVGPRTGMTELWRRVAEIQGTSKKESTDENLTAEELNLHYSSTSTDPAYTAPGLKQTVPEQASVIDEPTVFFLLDHLHHTADGNIVFQPGFCVLLRPPTKECWLILSIYRSHHLRCQNNGRRQ